jgi:Zn-dependent protease
MSAFVAEDPRSGNVKPLFLLFGVEWAATRWVWLNFVLVLALGMVVALVGRSDDELPVRFMLGIGYGVLIELSMIAHGAGHIISSRAVGWPMQSLILTATVPVTRFPAHQSPPRRAHVARALGGPLLNLLLAALCLAAWAMGAPELLGFFGAANVAIGAFTLLPIPTLDGAVLWHDSNYRSEPTAGA